MLLAAYSVPLNYYKLVRMWQRHDIEGRDPSTIAQSLSDAYDEHC